MRLSAIIGIVGGILTIVFVNHHEGDPIAALLNEEAAVIVLVGCFLAVLNHFQWSPVKRAFTTGLKWLVKPPADAPDAFVTRLIEWTRTARRDGLLSLEKSLAELEGDPFVHDGLQMVIDGVEVDALRTLLATRIETDGREDAEPGEVWNAIGGYSPTLGVLGAVMGLIHVMLHLHGSGLDLGSGIAAAFVATMYGVGLANLVFIPMGQRLGRIAARRARYREMVVEGLVLLAEGSNPQTLRTHLAGYFRPVASPRKKNDTEAPTATPTAAPEPAHGER